MHVFMFCGGCGFKGEINVFEAPSDDYTDPSICPMCGQLDVATGETASTWHTPTILSGHCVDCGKYVEGDPFNHTCPECGGVVRVDAGRTV